MAIMFTAYKGGKIGIVMVIDWWYFGCRDVVDGWEVSKWLLNNVVDFDNIPLIQNFYCLI